MMPELGKYAVEVLSAYAVSLVALIGLVVISLCRFRSTRARMEQLEARRHG